MTDDDSDFVLRCIQEAQTLLEGVERTDNSRTLLMAAISLLRGEPDGEAIQKARAALAHYGK